MSFQCHLYKYNQVKWLKDGFMFLKHKETNNGSVSKVRNLDFYCGGYAKLTTGLNILSGCQSVCTFPSALCSLRPPFVSILPQVISLMCLTCVSLLPRPLVDISQAFLVLVASLSGLLSEQWFVCAFVCLVFDFGLNKDGGLFSCIFGVHPLVHF